MSPEFDEHDRKIDKYFGNRKNKKPTILTVKTKKPLKSWELWALFLYALVEYLPKLFNDPIFQQIMHDEMYWITPLFMLVMAGLRIFKTKQGISFDHWKPKKEPVKVNENPVERELEKDNDKILEGF